MTSTLSVTKLLLLAFAIIGVFAVLAIAGMSFMHGNMMESFPAMAAACKNTIVTNI